MIPTQRTGFSGLVFVVWLLAWSIVQTLFASVAVAQGSVLSKGACKKDATERPVFGAECGYIKVPEAPESLQSAQLDIYILRIPSIRKSNKPPIVFIAGGPGQASTDLAENFRYQFHPLLIEHDFVFVDQRGTGKSHPLECDADLKNQLHLSSAEIGAQAQAHFQSCLARYAADLTRYTTPYAVTDLEAVRKQLGYEKLFLWGGSYGTRVLLHYLRAHSSALAGVIMDGVAPIAIQLPTYSEEDASHALAKVLANCAAQAACAQAFPNLKQRWLNLLARLQDKPQKQPLKHPRTQETLDVYVDPETISSWVRLSLYNRDVSSLLPLAMSAATRGDFSQLFSIQALSLDTAAKQISEGMHMAVLCAEDRAFPRPSSGGKTSAAGHVQVGEIQTEKLLHLPMLENMRALCDLLPKSRLPESYFSAVTSSVPTLLLSGDFDPITPQRWGDYAQLTLSLSKHVVIPGGHHIVSPLGCVPKLIGKFVADPSAVARLDTECTEKIKPLHYFIDGAGPQLDLYGQKKGALQ